MATDNEEPKRRTERWREPWPGALDDLKAHIDKHPGAAALLAEFMAHFPEVTRDEAIQTLWDQGILPRA